MKRTLGLILTLCLAGIANANVVDLKWTTTAQDLTGGVPGIVGEAITTTIRVDNGGASTFSQSWGTSDFLSYRVEGASGWWMQSTDISVGGSFGSFSTDALGNVLTAGDWIGLYFSGGHIDTSWAGLQLGGWWNNGANEVACTSGASDCVWANNVSDNLLGASWTAAAATEVPEPVSIALVGLGLLGLGFARKNRAL